MNKRLFVILLIFIAVGVAIGVLISSCGRQQANSSTYHAKNVETLINKMTIEHKIDKMTQISLYIVSNYKVYIDDEIRQINYNII